MSVPLTYLPGPGTTIPNLGWLLMANGLPIPNDPGFVNCVFYAQALAWDRAPGGGQQLVTSGAVRIRVGDGLDVPASSLVRRGDNSSPTGAIWPSRAVTLRINS